MGTQYLQAAMVALSMRGAVDVAPFQPPEDLTDHVCTTTIQESIEGWPSASENRSQKTASLSTRNSRGAPSLSAHCALNYLQNSSSSANGSRNVSTMPFARRRAAATSSVGGSKRMMSSRSLNMGSTLGGRFFSRLHCVNNEM